MGHKKGHMTWCRRGKRKYLSIGDVDELKEEYEANQNGLSIKKTKAGIQITLVHEETKHEQREEEINLKWKLKGLGYD